MFVVLTDAKLYFITCAKQNGKFINIIWKIPMATQGIVVMIQMERRDASIIMFILNWLLQSLAGVEFSLGVTCNRRWGGTYCLQGSKEALTCADEMGVVEVEGGG